MNFQYQNIDELTTKTLYQILQLRAEVFVVEQNCVYNDLDGLDIDGIHMYLKEDGRIIAYSRLLKAGSRFPYASIGRVVVHPKFRKRDLGKKMMEEAIQYIFGNWKVNEIKVSAQKYLQRFYEELGFEIVTEEYLEDGIPHFGMIYKK